MGILWHLFANMGAGGPPGDDCEDLIHVATPQNALNQSMAAMAAASTAPAAAPTAPAAPVAPAPAAGVPAGHAAPVAVPPGMSPFDDAGYALDDRFIGRGCSYVHKVSRQRLSQCMEHICPHLDSTFTAECTQHGLLCLLWIYTRIKPSVRIVDLRTWNLKLIMTID